MLQPYAALRPTIQSGDVIAFRRAAVSSGDDVGLYSHIAIAWVIGGRVLLLESGSRSGAHIAVASERLCGHCDLIRIKANWTSSVEQWALSAAGRGLAYLKTFLASIGLHIISGTNISSLFAAAILKRAGVHLSEQGYTPQALVDDLLSLGAQLQRLDCQAVGNTGLARIQILNQQGNPMTTGTQVKGSVFKYELAFDAANGTAVSIPASVEQATSDATIATAAIVNTPASADGTMPASDALEVTAVGIGSAVITVTSGTVSATLDLTVEEAALASIVIGPGTDITPPVVPVAG